MCGLVKHKLGKLLQLVIDNFHSNLAVHTPQLTLKLANAGDVEIFS